MKTLQVFPWNNYYSLFIDENVDRKKEKRTKRKQCEHRMTKRLVSAIQPEARSHTTHNNPYRFLPVAEDARTSYILLFVWGDSLALTLTIL